MIFRLTSVKLADLQKSSRSCVSSREFRWKFPEQRSLVMFTFFCSVFRWLTARFVALSRQRLFLFVGSTDLPRVFRSGYPLHARRACQVESNKARVVLSYLITDERTSERIGFSAASSLLKFRVELGDSIEHLVYPLYSVW